MSSLANAGRTEHSRAAWMALRGVLVALLFAVCSGHASAAEVMPPKPPGYFNDSAAVVSKEAAERFNEQLAAFERETSNQLVVAVYPKMETDSSIEDYTQRIAQSWGVGQQDRRNGAVLFVFAEDRKMFIQVGYGLEGALPDVTAFDITERRIKLRFRAQDYEGGLAVGIDSMMKAVRGEYVGTGKTNAEGRKRGTSGGSPLLLLLFVAVLLAISFGARKNRRRGWGYGGHAGPFIGGWSMGSGGWGGGSGGGWGGGSSGGGFSGFSGGGGDFGGGGAGSDW